METQHCEELLISAGVKPTANRLLVLKALVESPGPMSMKEIGEQIPTMDKSSIFRVLTLLHQNDVLHMLDGDSDGVRYEVCRGNRHGDEDSDEHIHFHCLKCGQTICLENIAIPHISLTADYQVLHREYTVKGICPNCR